MFPNVVVLAFFAVVSSHYTAADKAPPLWPSHWLLRIARKWMNVVDYKEGAMRDGPQDALSRSARMDDG